MARKISSGNIAYKLRRGQPGLLCPPISDPDVKLDDAPTSTYRADFKKPPLPTPPARGKRQELLERYLFEKISEDIAKEAFAPRSIPDYISTAHAHHNVPGFDPDARMKPSFDYSLYSDPLISYWSENRKNVHGVTVTDNPTKNFNSSYKFSKTPAERYDNGEDW